MSADVRAAGQALEAALLAIFATILAASTGLALAWLGGRRESPAGRRSRPLFGAGGRA